MWTRKMHRRWFIFISFQLFRVFFISQKKSRKSEYKLEKSFRLRIVRLPQHRVHRTIPRWLECNKYFMKNYLGALESTIWFFFFQCSIPWVVRPWKRNSIEWINVKAIEKKAEHIERNKKKKHEECEFSQRWRQRKRQLLIQSMTFLCCYFLIFALVLDFSLSKNVRWFSFLLLFAAIGWMVAAAMLS